MCNRASACLALDHGTPWNTAVPSERFLDRRSIHAFVVIVITGAYRPFRTLPRIFISVCLRLRLRLSLLWSWPHVTDADREANLYQRSARLIPDRLGKDPFTACTVLYLVPG
jgi:hypothetical protein